MVMKGKSALYALAVAVLIGTMAVAALADDQQVMVETYGPAYSSSSNEPQADTWEFREAMETGALPGQPVGSSDAVCCGEISGPTIESGGQLFRPGVDSGP